MADEDTGKEIYLRWNILTDPLVKKVSCEAIHDDYERFRIILKDEEHFQSRIRILFTAPLAYRVMDEGKRLRTLKILQDFEWSPFYIVKNSKWLEWFHEENYGIYKDFNGEIVHYAIYTLDDCIDVLSVLLPKVEYLAEL